MNGVFNIIGQTKNKHNKKNRNNILNYIVTFLLISITWIPFSQGINFIDVFINMFKTNNLSLFGFALDLCEKANTSKAEFMIVIISTLIIVILELLMKYKNLKSCVQNKTFIRFIIIMFLCLLIIYCGKYGNFVDKSDFLYSDF